MAKDLHACGFSVDVEIQSNPESDVKSWILWIHLYSVSRRHPANRQLQGNLGFEKLLRQWAPCHHIGLKIGKKHLCSRPASNLLCNWKSWNIYLGYSPLSSSWKVSFILTVTLMSEYVLSSLWWHQSKRDIIAMWAGQPKFATDWSIETEDDATHAYRPRGETSSFKELPGSNAVL